MKVKFATLLIAATISAPGISPAEESYRGPLPDRQREIIHEMADNHEKIHREVELNKKGYTARTTSEDAEIAALIKEHFAYMQKRMGAGAMVRRWDPAFVEMVEHHDDITVTEKEIEGGLEVRVVGETKDAIKVAKNHAQIISGFVRTGEVHNEHPRVLR